jgi:hypothetical protein
MAINPTRSLNNLGNQIQNKLNSQVDSLRSEATAFAQDLENGIAGAASDIEGLINSGLTQSNLGNAINVLNEGGGLLTDAIAKFDGASFKNLLEDQIEDLFNDFIQQEFSLDFSPSSGSSTSANNGSSYNGSNTSGYSTPNALDNVLEKYASVNYRFVFGMLSTDEVNDPINTYRRSTPETVIINSGGGPTKGATPEGGEGLEFFIDNIEIGAIIAPTTRTRTSNATNISFQVTEPYSMGLFLQSCIVAAQKKGITNFNKAPYYLIIEWIGYDDDGKISTDGNLRRVIPITLVNMEFNVNEGGCTYDVRAIAWNEQTLQDTVQSTKTDVEIQGGDLVELLQTGGKSLTTLLNTRILEATQTQTTSKQDEYIIIFPKDPASSIQGGQPDNTNRATISLASTEGLTDEEVFASISGNPNVPVPSNFNAYRSRLLGLEASSQTADNIRQTVQNESTVNDIGKCKIASSVFKGGDTPFGIAAFEWDETKKIFTNGGAMQVSEDLRTFKWKKGTKIEKIIEELVLVSEYGKAAASTLENGRGNIPWFRIDSQCFLLENTNSVSATGDNPKIYVYRVLMYEVQSSHFQQPSTATVGTEEIARNVSKVYNYIYTGKNKDILDFSIDFKFAYFQSKRADGGMSSSDTRTQANDGVAPTQQTTLVENPGNQVVSQSGTAPVVEDTNEENRAGGARGTETPEITVARQFQKALVEGVDMINIEMKIMGDPYFIADSGMGNYSSGPGNVPTINADGSLDYQRNEVHFIINFRTPVDIGDNGLLSFPNSSVPVNAFSGLYRLTQVDNEFSGGTFTQTLKAFRVPNQPLDTGESGTPGENTPFIQGDAANNINNDPTLASGIVTNVQEAINIPLTVEEKLQNAFNVGFTDIMPNVNVSFGGEQINIPSDIASQFSELNLSGQLGDLQSQFSQLNLGDLQSQITSLDITGLPISAEDIRSAAGGLTAGLDTSSIQNLAGQATSALNAATSSLSSEDLRNQVNSAVNTISRTGGVT